MTGKEKIKYRAGKVWKVFRQKQMTKYKCTCQICGSRKYGKEKSKLQLHHLDEKHYTDLNESKFILLCCACHRELERLLIKNQDIKDYFSKLEQVYLKTLENKK